tara:strand:- start:1290 stop:2081 length:792 start_codon:yes stop_codon:yes gene_type:complete
MLGSGASLSPVITDMFNQQSISFNGTDQYIDLPDALATKIAGTTNTTTAEFTISCWAKVDVISASGAIFKIQANTTDNQINLLYHASSNEFRFSCKFGGTNVVSNGGTTNAAGDSYEGDDIWHNIVGTVSATADTQSIWIDGSEKEKTTTTVPTLDGLFTKVSIGRNSVLNNAFWKGDLKDIAIYNRKLTDEEIGIIYNRTGPSGNKCIDLASGSHVSNADLVAFYRLEDKGTVAFNQTEDFSLGLSYNGTYVNSPTRQTSTP